MFHSSERGESHLKLKQERTPGPLQVRNSMCKSKRSNKETKEHIYKIYSGEEACYLYNIQEVFQPGSTNGQTNVAMVEGMNHQYVYGGYL